MTLNQSHISWVEITTQFEKYGKVCRDWGEKTTNDYQAYLTRFRDWMEAPRAPLVELKDLDFLNIQQFVGYYVERHSPHSQKACLKSCAHFLPFVIGRGFTPKIFHLRYPQFGAGNWIGFQGH